MAMCGAADLVRVLRHGAITKIELDGVRERVEFLQPPLEWPRQARANAL
jgi:hypothetical protein